MITPARGRFSKVFALRWSRPVAVIVCAALGFLCPAVYGLVNGVREPLAHDEYSYLLAAYTFAEGRLTNPPPALPEFFEAPHVLVVPTYTSKYPPGQSLFLALGIVVGGSPIWGVWLGCGLFAGCLCWMLQAWSTRQWAIATTLLAIATLGTSTYWAQAYWGGMVAASGGALVFGGMRRTLHTVRISTSVLIAAGTLILANTRPYEGLITCLPAVVVLAVWLIRCDRVPSRIKLLSFALPVAIVLAAGAAGMAVYNRAVTGAFSASPYQVHQAQYWRQGPFVFSQPQNASRTPGDRVSGFYRYYRISCAVGWKCLAGESSEPRPCDPGIDRRAVRNILRSPESAVSRRPSLAGSVAVCLELALQILRCDPLGPRRPGGVDRAQGHPGVLSGFTRGCGDPLGVGVHVGSPAQCLGAFHRNSLGTRTDGPCCCSMVVAPLLGASRGSSTCCRRHYRSASHASIETDRGEHAGPGVDGDGCGSPARARRRVRSVTTHRRRRRAANCHHPPTRSVEWIAPGLREVCGQLHCPRRVGLQSARSRRFTNTLRARPRRRAQSRTSEGVSGTVDLAGQRII